MDAPYTPELATLGYVVDRPRGEVLMIHRDRPDDYHCGKFNGLGGKLLPDEDVVAGMRRELEEEAGLEAQKLRLAGTISWPGFGKQGEDWFGFVFLVDRWSGQTPPRCAEGTLLWVPLDDVLGLELWEGDRHFLPLLLDDPPRIPFHGVMPYAGGRPTGWSYTILD